MKNFDIIIANNATICYNRLAKTFTHFKTGGRINVYIQPKDVESLLTALDNVDDYLILGATTNTLISDSGYNGIVISTKDVKGIEVVSDGLIVNAGELLSNVCKIAKNNGFSGLESLSGIPGTIGGALAMNAGAYGHCIGEFVEYADVYFDGVKAKLDNYEMHFDYRKSILSDSKIVALRVKLKLIACNEYIIAQTMKSYSAKRRRMQPTEVSLGSCFKKCKDNGAGYYIENAGLKGYRVGGVAVSDKHANFLINTGNATSEDYYKLMNYIMDSVKEKYDIALEKEVILIGEFGCKL